jgi:hypothetical protein
VSYLQVHFWPGGTEEQYQAMIKVLHPEGLPKGQRAHISGPAEGGYLISVLWDSKEQSEAFMQNTLVPALAGGRRIRRVSGGAHRPGRPSRAELTPSSDGVASCTNSIPRSIVTAELGKCAGPIRQDLGEQCRVLPVHGMAHLRERLVREGLPGGGDQLDHPRRLPF